MTEKKIDPLTKTVQFFKGFFDHRLSWWGRKDLVAKDTTEGIDDVFFVYLNIKEKTVFLKFLSISSYQQPSLQMCLWHCITQYVNIITNPENVCRRVH